MNIVREVLRVALPLVCSPAPGFNSHSSAPTGEQKGPCYSVKCNRNPDVIEAGTQIVLPASVAPPRATAKYTVRHGDTLWSIAQTQLHHGASWSCIAQANPDLRDVNLLHEGQMLLLPASCLR